MTRLPTGKTIASEIDTQRSYSLRRCLTAERKDPDGLETMQAMAGAPQKAAQT